MDCCLVTRVYFDAISMAEARAAIDTAADVGNGAGDVSASGGPLLTSKVDLKWASINCSLPRPFVCRRKSEHNICLGNDMCGHGNGVRLRGHMQVLIRTAKYTT